MTQLSYSTQRMADFVTRYLAAHGTAPTYREIASGLGLSSVSDIRRQLTRLVDAGVLVVSSNRALGAIALPSAIRAPSLDEQALHWQADEDCLIHWHQRDGAYVGFQARHPERGLVATVGEVT